MFARPHCGAKTIMGWRKTAATHMKKLFRPSPTEEGIIRIREFVHLRLRRKIIRMLVDCKMSSNYEKATRTAAW